MWDTMKLSLKEFNLLCDEQLRRKGEFTKVLSHDRRVTQELNETKVKLQKADRTIAEAMKIIESLQYINQTVVTEETNCEPF